MCKVWLLIMQFLLFLGIYACQTSSNASSEQELHSDNYTDNINIEENMSKRTTELINSWKEEIKLTIEQVDTDNAVIEKDVGYEGIKNVSCIVLPNIDSKFFFYNSSGECAMLYISNEELMQELQLETIIKEYGNPEEIVRSRAGKQANQYLYPTKGIAFSELDGDILFIEIFSARTLIDYKTEIYIDPGEFIK